MEILALFRTAEAWNKLPPRCRPLVKRSIYICLFFLLQVRYSGTYPAHAGKRLDPPGDRKTLPQSQPVSCEQSRRVAISSLKFKCRTSAAALDFVVPLQERIQVPVLFGKSHRHGRHDEGLPALGQRAGNHAPHGPGAAQSQQPFLGLSQVGRQQAATLSCY